MLRLHLSAFGPFTDRVLDFGSSGAGLTILHGPNEAGKSSILRAISDLRFGVPQQSRDNFVHAYQDLRVGGEFVDRQGRVYSLIRRKGRGSTLRTTDFEHGDAESESPVSAEVEALLTGGLSKTEYESAFGLDHATLRAGGEALLKGEGEIGAALFEASAGLRSVPQLLESLDQSARKLFMPGARGKNARINEALTTYEGHHSEYRKALVKPAQWIDLSRKHQIAVEALAALEKSRSEISARQLLAKELRAVAPLIRSQDYAAQALAQLESTPILSSTAPTERAAAESGLAAATHHAAQAKAELSYQTETLASLTPDRQILDFAPAIRRLSAAAESSGRYQIDREEAIAESELERNRLIEIAQRIDAHAPLDELYTCIPSPSDRVHISQRLRAVERAQEAVEQHVASMRRWDADLAIDVKVEDLPAADVLTALKVAQSEIARSDTLLRRLETLPAEIKSAERTAKSALDRLNLPDEAALHRARPLLDAQIDEAVGQMQIASARREELARRIDALTTEVSDETLRRDQLLAQGVTVTPADVVQARNRRDDAWRLVRSIYIEGEDLAPRSISVDRPLAIAYEDAVQEADRVADELARDSERAAQLQATLGKISELNRRAQEHQGQLDAATLADREKQQIWASTTAAANLPLLSPAETREWQASMVQARAAFDLLQSRLDEFEAHQSTAQVLGTKLRNALERTGMASPGADATVETLVATALRVEELVRLREAAASTAIGKELERTKRREQAIVMEEHLRLRLAEAKLSLAPSVRSLRLIEDVSVDVVRARVEEFEMLQRVRERLAEAESKLSAIQGSLAALEEGASVLARAVGEAGAGDMRLLSERLSARLSKAEEADRRRALAESAQRSALDRLREHEIAVSKHETTLATLCSAAGVTSVAELPEAEERSRRKLEAHTEADRSQRQLAQASARTLTELRGLLVGRDVASMEADELACVSELVAIDEKIGSARANEEAARRALAGIDSADTAIVAREAMERAAAAVRITMPIWVRSRIAHSLLSEALKRFRDRAQGPMLRAASGYFSRMTSGQFVQLQADDAEGHPVLVALRSSGGRVTVDGMSEGTRDQLYLSLRLAALELRRSAGVDLPVVLDDVLTTSDDLRAINILRALIDFASENQVVVFTHHQHLVELARNTLSPSEVHVINL